MLLILLLMGRMEFEALTADIGRSLIVSTDMGLLLDILAVDCKGRLVQFVHTVNS